MPRRVRARSSRSSVRRRRRAVVSTRSVVERGAVDSGMGEGPGAGATPMTGMPTGEVEADPADGVEVADGATALGGSTSVGALPSPPAGGGEPGAASVMKPILRGEPVQALLRGKDPRAEVSMSK